MALPSYKHALILTTPHLKGKKVKVAQHLMAGGSRIMRHHAYHGKIDGVFGPETAHACKAAKYRLGIAKRKCTPVYGQTLHDLLLGKRKLSAAMKLRRKLRARARRKWAANGGLRKKALDLAATQIGYVEAPGNMNKYGRWYGANGVPWCAIFVSWVLSHAGHSFHYSYVPTIVADARASRHGMHVVSFSGVNAALVAGHVVLACFDWPGESPGTADHVGFVVGTHSDGSFTTIEGNTSNEVARRVRFRNEVLAFVVIT